MLRDHRSAGHDRDRRGPLRPEGSEVDRLLCDYSVAERIAGWRPEVSLEDGLAATAEWVAAHLADLETSAYQI